MSRLADALSTEFHVSRYHAPAANLFERQYGLLGYDIVLYEGTAIPDQPIVLLLDENGNSQEAPSSAGQVIATIGPAGRATAGTTTADTTGTATEITTRTTTRAPAGPGSDITDNQVPHHHPEDVAGIAATVRSRLLTLAEQRPLYGLVPAGGKSRRMGRPKWALEYQGAPQALHIHQLLESHCQHAFRSINQNQLQEPALTSRPPLVDRFAAVGPLGGILTAMSTHSRHRLVGAGV